MGKDLSAKPNKSDVIVKLTKIPTPPRRGMP